MPAEINKAIGILTEMTEKSPGTLYMGIYSSREANAAIRLAISELTRLREENELLKGEADEHALFDAETDVAFKDLDATIDDLKEQVATLTRERDDARDLLVPFGEFAELIEQETNGFEYEDKVALALVIPDGGCQVEMDRIDLGCFYAARRQSKEGGE